MHKLTESREARRLDLDPVLYNYLSSLSPIPFFFNFQKEGMVGSELRRDIRLIPEHRKLK